MPIKFTSKQSLSMAGVVFITATVLGMVAQGKAKPDSITNCPPDNLGALTIGMVDKTDPFQNGEGGFILRKIRDIAAQAKTNDHIMMFKIGPDIKRYGIPNPLFNMCKPPDGSGAYSINAGKDDLRRKFEKRFKAPFEDALGFVGEKEEYEHSQIFELTASLKNREEVQNAENIQLVIFTNGIQNSAGVSQYPKSNVYFKLFSEFKKSPYFKGMNFGDFLKKTDIKIVYLVSKETEAFQTLENRGFLLALFKDAGARSVQLIDHKTY